MAKYLLMLLVCVATLSAEEKTTIEVKSGTVVVKSAAGETNAQAGDTVVVNQQKMVKTREGGSVSPSYSAVIINGKLIEVTGEGGNEAHIRNGQITIRIGDRIITGDSSALKIGESSYDISKSDKVSITIEGDQVDVDTSGAMLPGSVKLLPPQVLIIGIDQKGTYQLGSEAVTLEQLRTKLKGMVQQNPMQIVFIKSDHRTRHDDVVKILELCRRAGLKNVSVLEKRPE